jgi:hypothetical protein
MSDRSARLRPPLAPADPSRRRVAGVGSALALAAVLPGCASTPAAPARFEGLDDGVDLPITWLSLPRPAPLPPLDHAALLVPVRFGGPGSHVFYLQFDLGHPSTLLYANKWAGIAERYGLPAAGPRLASLDFLLGESRVRGRDLALLPREGAGVDWDRDVELVGTLGADLIDGRAVLLDFQRDRIRLARDRSGLHGPGAQFQPFSFSGRRILMPVEFDGQRKTVMYDSGSSAFAWLTDEKTCQRLARPGSKVVSYPVRSWGQVLTAHSVDTDAVARIGTVELSLGQISHIQGMGLLQEMAISSLGVGGLVGNKLFLGRRLVVDTRRLEIAVES